MKTSHTIIISLIFLVLSQNIFSQDYDVYKRTVDDNIKIPEIYKNMLLEEYQLLSRDIRMMDMSYAMIVPGYVHFKAKENKKGYYILGTRLAGYAGITTYYLRRANEDKQLWDYITGKDNNINLNDKYLFVTSLTLIIGSYLYDWIHGKYMLEKKQENIKYKYGIKFKMEESLSSSYHPNYKLTPSISISLNF